MAAHEIIGINRRWYPDPNLLTPGGEEVECLCTVLVEGGIGDYAAYQGLGDRPEWVARFGDKICFAEAKVHFPGIEEEKYRP